MTDPGRIKGEQTMLVSGDWTGQLASERMAEFHRQAGRQRLVRLARTQRRRGNRRVSWGRRLLAGWLRGSGEAVTEPSTLVSLVEPTNRPALWLLRSLDVELAFRDGLVQGRQHLPRQPPTDVPCGSGSATQWTSPPGGDPSNRPARRHRPWPYR